MEGGGAATEEGGGGKVGVVVVESTCGSGSERGETCEQLVNDLFGEQVLELRRQPEGFIVPRDIVPRH